MSPQCSICGQETSYVPQYQQWYCYMCNTYPFMSQAAPAYQYPQPYPPMYYCPPQPCYPQSFYVPPQPFPQPVQYQSPAVQPTVQASIARVQSSVWMRQSTDIQMSPKWAWAIVLFQIVLPVSAVMAVYALLLHLDEEEILSNSLLLAIILVVLLVFIGLAVANSVLAYKLVGRRDGHFRRDSLLFEGQIEHLAAVSQETQIDLNVERWTMNTLHLGNPPQERSPGLWAILIALIVIIPIMGIICLVYCLFFLTEDLRKHDERQRAINRQYEAGLLKAGRITSVSDAWQPLPRRQVGFYVVLSILTLGAFLSYWWYVNIEDMNTHFKNQSEFENALIERLKAEV